jgi:ACT domain-containing protein
VTVSPPPGLTTLSSSVQETKVNAIIAEKKKDFIMVFGVKKWEKEHTKVFVITHIVKTNIFLG